MDSDESFVMSVSQSNFSLPSPASFPSPGHANPEAIL